MTDTNHHTGSRGVSSRIHPKGVARRLDAPRFAFRRGEFLLIFVQAIRLTTSCFVYSFILSRESYDEADADDKRARTPMTKQTFGKTKSSGSKGEEPGQSGIAWE